MAYLQLECIKIENRNTGNIANKTKTTKLQFFNSYKICIWQTR